LEIKEKYFNQSKVAKEKLNTPSSLKGNPVYEDPTLIIVEIYVRCC